MATASIKNGNEGSPPELGPGVVKVIVVGESQVGKTDFIRGYYDRHEPGEINSYKGVKFYHCEFAADDAHGRTAIFEIPARQDSYREQRTPHYKDAKVIVLMYAIDEPSSLEKLSLRWLPEIGDDLAGKAVVVVGNKSDTRDDPEVLERLALNHLTPVTHVQVSLFLELEGINDFFEITTCDLEEVDEVFDIIFHLALKRN